MRHCCCTFLLIGLLVGICQGAEIDPQELQFFESKIRPVLVKHCYECHSADALKKKNLEGELFLDTRQALLKGGESGPSIVPGMADKSLLIKALRHEDDLEMPEEKLSKEIIADFVRWIEMGAPDPRDGKPVELVKKTIDLEKARQFWSFRPLQPIKVPEPNSKDWIRNDVDRYIAFAQESQGVKPAAGASRRVLIRRLYYGLLGLPPTQTQVKSFVNDSSPDAYDKLVDSLLQSEHFGERWARHWLDLARFAESNGYAFDKDRAAAFHYRDFVIKALNSDLPYDEFTRLQIAGDLLRPDDYMGIAATGFLMAGPFTTQQTAKERERSRYEQLDDMIGTLGNSMLGLSLGCCRCHDHKSDPLTSHDYYRMISSFAEVGFQDFGLDEHPEIYRKAKAEYDKQYQPLVAARAAYEKDKLPAGLAEWIKNRPVEPAPPEMSPWQTIGPFTAADFNKAYDQNFGPEKRVDLKKGVGKLKWQAKPEWKDGVVYNTLMGVNAANYLYRTIEADAPGSVQISVGQDDAIRVYLNDKHVFSQKSMGGVSADQHQVTLALQPGSNRLVIKIVNASGPSGFYFKVSDSGPPENVRKILDLATEKRNAKQQQELLKWYRQLDEQWRSLNNTVVEQEKKAPKQNLTKIYSARNGGTTYNFGGDTRKVYHLVRGNSNNKQDLATPGFLQVLMRGDSAEKRWTSEKSGDQTVARPPRVAMAQWITDTEHGAGVVLARVMVNRIWQHHFGRGIVASPSDFGFEGVRPTHPELLDFLAAKLIENKWSLKSIHRLILTSRTYQQSGASNANNQKADPDNQLFARQPSRRLEAEAIRDALLTVSGRLDRRMFGKGALNELDNRRSIYLTVKRGSLVPILQIFDAPDAIQSIGDRNATTVPPQALAMMNSSFARTMADAFAKSIRPNNTISSADVVSSGYWEAMSRAPSDEELQHMTAFIGAQAKSYGDNEAGMQKAVADFCHLLLCMNEFIYVD